MAHEDSRDGTADEIYTRRRLLEASGATALAMGIAGCGGSSGDQTSGETDATADGDTTTGGTTAKEPAGGTTAEGTAGDGTTASDAASLGEPVDPQFNLVTGANPTNSQFNYFNPANYAGFNDLLYNLLWRYNWRTGEYHARIGTNYSLDGTTLTFDINTDYKWASDGEPVTATDVRKQLLLEQFINDPVWNYISEVSKDGEETITIELQREYNPDLVRALIGQDRYIVVKRGSIYDDWLGRLQDASSDSERTEIADEFQTTSLFTDNKNPVANGPYTIGSTTASEWTLERNENFPYRTNVSQMVLAQSPSNSDAWQRMIGDELDGSGILAVPSNIQQQLPDNFVKLSLPAAGTYAPMFNFDTQWGSRPARQAFTYLMDRELVDQNVNPRLEALQRVTGLTYDLAQKVLGESFIEDSLTNYGIESQPEMAAQVLRDAGYEKPNDQWMTPEGEPLTMTWVGPSFPGSTGYSQTLKQLLPDFGIEYEGVILSPPQWISRRQEENYDHSFNYIGGGPSPFFFMSAVITSTRSALGNWPRETVELPPVGEPDGDPTEFDLQAILQQITTATSDEPLAEATRRYSWYINQELPVTQLASAAYPVYMTNDDWEFPSPDADVMGLRSPYHQLLRETEEGSDVALLQGATQSG